MLKYLVIQLADDSTSYCHFNNDAVSEQFMPIDTLKAAIRFGMVENLNIQFVYPKRALPVGYSDVVETIDHTKIMPAGAAEIDKADIVVYNSIAELDDSVLHPLGIVILRINRQEITELPRIYNSINGKCNRLNVVITDIDKFVDGDFDTYKNVLMTIGAVVKEESVNKTCTQLNLINDRMLLQAMNNCNAGNESITLMPNGKFYPCAGFYFDNPDEDFGDLSRGVAVKNMHLFKLANSPICRNCDAYQCRRCVWLNRRTTLEVNTPSRQQCVVAHLERNESGKILTEIRKNIDYAPGVSVQEIDYLDPFDNRKNW